MPLYKQFWKHKMLVLMFLPGFIFIILFKYYPMPGIIIAFKDYKINMGIWGSPWVGLEHFQKLFSSPVAVRSIRNTIIISLYRLFWGFPAPIILALMINEVQNKPYKKFVQTVSYLPHFMSWIIVSGIFIRVLSIDSGIINQIIKFFGGEPIFFMAEKKWFRTILVASGIWKDIGWGTIIYLAALSGIDQQMYEAAVIDGATRFQRIIYITLPSLLPLISIVLILSMGGIMNAGFDQIFNMYNARVAEVSEILDTYVYKMGMVNMKYSYSAAIGLFKSVVGLILVFIVNKITSSVKDNEFGLW